MRDGNPAQAPDNDRLALLAEALHTGWRKGTDGPQAMTVHALIRDMDPGDWGEYVQWVDWCLAEVSYRPGVPDVRPFGTEEARQ